MYRRHLRDVLMGRHSTYHWDDLVTYYWDVVECFIWDLFERLRTRAGRTLLPRPLERSSRLSNKTSLGVSFWTYLRRRWDEQRNVITTSTRRLVAGWVAVVFTSIFHFIFLFYVQKQFLCNLYYFCCSKMSFSSLYSFIYVEWLWEIKFTYLLTYLLIYYIAIWFEPKSMWNLYFTISNFIENKLQHVLLTLLCMSVK